MEERKEKLQSNLNRRTDGQTDRQTYRCSIAGSRAIKEKKRERERLAIASCADERFIAFVLLIPTCSTFFLTQRSFFSLEDMTPFYLEQMGC